MDGLTESGQAMGGLPARPRGHLWHHEDAALIWDALGVIATSQQLIALSQQRIEEKLMSQQDIDAAVAAMNAARDDMNRVAAQIGSATPPPPPDDTTALAQATADLGTAQAALDAAVPAEVAP